MQTGRASPPLAACTALVVYTLIYDQLSVEDVFVTITLFQAMRPIAIMLPMAFAALASFGNALRRVEGFLLEEDQPSRTLLESDRDRKSALKRVAVDVVNADFAWAGDGVAADQLDLSEVSFQAKRGEVTAIVGAVGSGKTTLISAVVGDLLPNAGTVKTAATIGFVPQKAFIISDSVENNILFGRPKDKARLDKVIDAAEFTADLLLLPDGLSTIIGVSVSHLLCCQIVSYSRSTFLFGFHF
jgi:ABC-type multidrug transport system fused ATPase/permease subunit